MARHFRELTCWRLANELKIAVYAVSETAEAAGDRSFCDDLRRAARSAPANIAEGFGRYTHRDSAHYLAIARASLMEIENHLHHARDIGAIDADTLRTLSDLTQRAQRSVSALRTYLIRTPDRPAKRPTIT